MQRKVISNENVHKKYYEKSFEELAKEDELRQARAQQKSMEEDAENRKGKENNTY